MERMRFDAFSKELAEHFAKMTDNHNKTLFQVDVDKDDEE